MAVNKKSVKGLSVDTWGEQVLLEDDLSGIVVTLSEEEAEELVELLIHGMEKARENKRKKNA